MSFSAQMVYTPGAMYPQMTELACIATLISVSIDKCEKSFYQWITLNQPFKNIDPWSFIADQSVYIEELSFSEFNFKPQKRMHRDASCTLYMGVGLWYSYKTL